MLGRPRNQGLRHPEEMPWLQALGRGCYRPATTRGWRENGPRTPVNRPKHYQKHGIHTLKNAVRTLGKRALPSRSTALGRARHEWRTSLVADLGGPDAVSTQQRSLADLATTTELMVDSVDAYVLTMGRS